MEFVDGDDVHDPIHSSALRSEFPHGRHIHSSFYLSSSTVSSFWGSKHVLTSVYKLTLWKETEKKHEQKYPVLAAHSIAALSDHSQLSP